MFVRILHRIREQILSRQYVMTLHAEEEMDADDLTIFDVERSILTGGIARRQKDRETGEWKYVVVGQAGASLGIGVVAKLSPTGKLVIITVWVE
ncbi:MAG: DUF4258 domain-containing protein [Dehalococcoidia bacterium]|nr:DUF4258 domain-containing protein [Dehalococcoidia bacterium]